MLPGPLALVLMLAAPARAQQPAPAAGPAPATRPGPAQLFVRGASSMGTRVTVSLWTESETEAARAAALVFDEFRRIDDLMTTWREDSDVSRINAAAGGPPVVGARWITVITSRATTTGGPPAAALMRETSLSSRHVVIRSSMRRWWWRAR